MPWETLLFGRGTAMERAWVFILLCRQQRLDAVLLALGDPTDAGKPDGKSALPGEESLREESLRPWAVAVLSEGALYLFDPVLGLPIPAPDGVKLDAAGQLDIEPATLAQVVADEALLRQLDAGPAHPYPVKSSDLKRIVALVEASPSYLALRMKLVEARLDPQQNMVLSTAPTRLAAGDLKARPQVAETRLWTLPLETIRRRLQLSPRRIAQRLRAQLPFFVAHGLPQGKGGYSQPLLKEVDPFYLPLKASARKGVIEAPLHMGRMLYLKGKFADRHGAIEYFVEARQSDKQLKEEEEQRIAVYCARAREANRQQPADRRLPDVQIVRIATQSTATKRRSPFGPSRTPATGWG